MISIEEAKKKANESGYHFCHKEDPWPGEGRCVHWEAKEIGEQKDGWPGGDMVTRKCNICGHQWEEELPQ